MFQLNEYTAAGAVLFVAAVCLAAYTWQVWCDYRIEREEERMRKAWGEIVSTIEPGDPWDGATFEWPEDQTITSFLSLDGYAPEVAHEEEEPAPLSVEDDADAFIKWMRESTDETLARLAAPLNV